MTRYRIAETFVLAVILAAPGALAAPAQPAAKGAVLFDAALYQAMEYRSIGPYRGGRVTAVTGVRSEPDIFYMGSTGGGVWKSTNAGDTWTKLEGGLPQGIVCRIGVAVSPTRPSRVWALVEAEKGGLFRSEDGGKSFELVNDDRCFRQRAWYYTHAIAHPTDENTVFVLNTAMYKSIDSGKSYERIPDPHGDNHDLWLNPDNPRSHGRVERWGRQRIAGRRQVVVAPDQPTDGGVLPRHRRRSVPLSRLRCPAGQFDHLHSQPHPCPGITRQYWNAMGGGESGYIAVDPRDPNIR